MREEITSIVKRMNKQGKYSKYEASPLRKNEASRFSSLINDSSADYIQGPTP